MDKRGINLHHVDHSGANRKYYLAILAYINRHPEYDINITTASLSEFIEKGVPNGTDVLSYQTFPDERNEKKFNPSIIYKSDCVFHSFAGKKILVDVHDCGDNDSFTRIFAGKEMPRVKCFPSTWFLENYNVILCSTVSANPGVFPDKYERNIQISCKFGQKCYGFYGHTIRETVLMYLRTWFNELTNFDWVSPKSKYFEELLWTKIVIGAPGWGRYNGSYWGAIKAGALLFAHCSLNDIKLFPHVDLVDGDDYISYDLFNFKTKLKRLLFHPEEIERIRNNGRQKFKDGLDYKKSADQFVSYLKGEVK